MLVLLTRLKGVPVAVLRNCGALATLTLHGNPVTVEQLRESDGFAEFNARRCAKHDKQVPGPWQFDYLRPSFVCADRSTL